MSGALTGTVRSGPTSTGSLSVAVLTPTVEGREEMLAECRASVTAQTVPVEHLVEVDVDGCGPQRIRNRLATVAQAEWLLPLDDDDLLDPECVEVLLERCADADVVYPWCRVDGRDDFFIVNKLFHPGSLFVQNYIPVTALIRSSFFRMLGGYRDVELEDHDLWQRAYLHGGRFVCVPEVLWTYRFLGQNTYQAAA